MCFADWADGRQVGLVFSGRAVGSIIGLCDVPTWTIGLLARARRLGSVARVETIVHECCHLLTGQYHTAAWKRAMRRSARRARAAGLHRLAAMIERDAADYERRAVSEGEVRRRLALLMRHLHDRSYGKVLRHLADGSGWPVREFARRAPWLRAAWAAARG